MGRKFMTINEYQKKAHETSKYSVGHFVDDEKEIIIEADWLYPALALSEEAGEVAGKFAKAIRDENGIITEKRRIEIIKELGDVQWFIAELCTLLGADLEIVMQMNIVKLADRAKRGVINGSGDNR